MHFLNIATGSAAETLYLLSLARRLGMLTTTSFESLETGYSELVKGLKKLRHSLENQP